MSPSRSCFFTDKFSAVVLAVALAAFAPTIRAAQTAPVETMLLKSNGTIAWDGVDISATYFTPDWESVDQNSLKPATATPVTTSAAAASWQWTVTGSLPVPKDKPGRSWKLEQRLELVAKNTLSMDYRATFPSGYPGGDMCLVITVPVEIGAGERLLLDDETVRLPETLGEPELFKRMVGSLTLPTAAGRLTVTGNFFAYVQDNRKWGADAFVIRLHFPPDDLRLAVTARYQPHTSIPIAFVHQANQGFADKVANDGTGGWSDQGPENDLSPLKPGLLHTAGIDFSIIDPAGNGGKSALVFSGPGGRTFISKTEIPVPGAPALANLYLLHATAWTPSGPAPVGEITVHYTDGTSEKVSVEASRDVGDWWSPLSLPNGIVGWQGENRSSQIGLYVSRFAITPKPVGTLTISASGRAVWMIAGISGSTDDIRIGSDASASFKITPDINWQPFAWSRDIEPGSVMDFSFLNDGEAGQQGFLAVTPAGHLAFEKQPETPVRFWGVNLCFSALFLEKPQADALAERLARSGYNTLRIHHYDGDLLKKGGKSWEFDPGRLDRLDYLFAAMKKRGIYLNIDLYINRRFSTAEIPELGRQVGPDEFKALAPISENAYAAFIHFAKNLLTHVNPYTGLAWGRDPALIGICPVNELSLVEFPTEPRLRALYDAAFAKWRAARTGRDQGGDIDSERMRFLVDIQAQFDRRVARDLHALGVRALLTGSNWRTAQVLGKLRQAYDYVDNHMYWDHPLFPVKDWELPFKYIQTSATRRSAYVPAMLMPSRVFGKPYVITEFNYTSPNQYRAEGGLLMPAYASLQDWDGLYNFDYITTPRQLAEPPRSHTFDIGVDPIGLLADRFSALVFRRRDVAPAKHSIGFVLRDDRIFSPGSSRAREFDSSYVQLGLAARVGVLPEGATADARVADQPGEKDRGQGVYASGDGLAGRLIGAGVLPAWTMPEAQRVVSDTGEIDLNANAGTFKLVTPRTEGFVLPPETKQAGHVVTAENGAAFATVSATAVDGLPLMESRRILILHLTDAQNSGIEFSDKSRRLLVDLGTAPHLVLRGSTQIQLHLPAGEGRWEAWQVAPTGARLREQPLRRDTKTGVITMTLETVTPDGVCLAYELARLSPGAE